MRETELHPEEGLAEIFKRQMLRARDAVFSDVLGVVERKPLPHYVGDKHSTVHELHYFYWLKASSCGDDNKTRLYPQDVVLIELISSQNKRVQAVIKKNNLYLIGFRTRGGFFEMKWKKDQKTNTMEGATFINVDVGYGIIYKFDKKDHPLNIADVFEALRLDNAINRLSKVVKGLEDLKPFDIGVVVIMTLESIRFNSVMEGLTRDREMTMKQLDEEVFDWGTASGQLWTYRNGLDSARSEIEKRKVEFGSAWYATVAAAARRITLILKSDG